MQSVCPLSSHLLMLPFSAITLKKSILGILVVVVVVAAVAVMAAVVVTCLRQSCTERRHLTSSLNIITVGEDFHEKKQQKGLGVVCACGIWQTGGGPVQTSRISHCVGKSQCVKSVSTTVHENS